METLCEKNRVAASNLQQGGLRLNYNVSGYLRQSMSMQQKLKPSQVWLQEASSQSLLPSFIFHPRDKAWFILWMSTCFRVTQAAHLCLSGQPLALSPYESKLCNMAKLLATFHKIHQNLKTLYPRAEFKSFFIPSHKSLWRDSSRGMKRLFKICLSTFHQFSWGEGLCSVVQHPCDCHLWQTPQSGTESWHVRVSHFAVRHWHGPLKRQPFILQSTHYSEIMLVVRLHVANVQSACLQTTKDVQVYRQFKATVFTCCTRRPWNSSCRY